MEKFQYPADMPYDIKWIYPKMQKPNAFFRAVSKGVIGAVGLISKIIVVLLNKTSIYNIEVLENIVENRPKNQPLLTYSNHYSCGDDPGIFGCLKLRNVCSPSRIRWSVAAHDICFTNFWHSSFFMYGKCIPVIRGGGIYQPAIDMCIEKLKLGEWVHIFPEGKVNMEKEYMRLKWGIGRILKELYPIQPIIIPIYHIGMDNLLPNYPPYYFRFNNKLTFNFGNPIDISDVMKNISDNNVDDITARKMITDKLQEQLNIIRVETEKLHNNS
ncbi:hypothetical protein PVAND_007529 [Polypedilum vanderplanki]|uniref:Tafazzin family protein n=1 Tax=Polypedilum vanderplanki TaxID=319348 RepID=A0A9J6C6T8_POLVA|nr:hypothetical protein PVAND_007529 [Polypedilum vanderplanki]